MWPLPRWSTSEAWSESLKSRICAGTESSLLTKIMDTLWKKFQSTRVRGPVATCVRKFQRIARVLVAGGTWEWHFATRHLHIGDVRKIVMPSPRFVSHVTSSIQRHCRLLGSSLAEEFNSLLHPSERVSSVFRPFCWHLPWFWQTVLNFGWWGTRYFQSGCCVSFGQAFYMQAYSLWPWRSQLQCSELHRKAQRFGKMWRWCWSRTDCLWQTLCWTRKKSCVSIEPNCTGTVAVRNRHRGRRIGGHHLKPWKQQPWRRPSHCFQLLQWRRSCRREESSRLRRICRSFCRQAIQGRRWRTQRKWLFHRLQGIWCSACSSGHACCRRINEEIVGGQCSWGWCSIHCDAIQMWPRWGDWPQKGEKGRRYFKIF